MDGVFVSAGVTCHILIHVLMLMRGSMVWYVHVQLSGETKVVVMPS